MKTILRRLAAMGLSAAVLAGSALALTPQELGEILENEYAGDLPAQVWEQTTVAGMLQALGDPFTHYYSAEEYARFQAAMNGGPAGVTVETAREDNVGLIRLSSFGSGTYEALKSGMEEIGRVDHWIVDLRGNPGGELKAAVDAMSAFAGKGEVVYLSGKDDKIYSAKSDKAELTMAPAVVLMDGDTASAAELFAATLRDRQRALLIGSRTYGKGVAQSAFDQTSEAYGTAFADGSALVLTTQRVYSDTMTSNNILGVLPYLEVEADMAQAVAKLLCAPAPAGTTEGYLRLSLARWRWYVDLSTADAAALKALMEALPPQAELYVGTGGEDSWTETTAVEYGKAHISGFAPRTFSDVAGSDYADAINALKTYGIVKGDETGSFHPQSALDRASLCALLAQAMNYPMSQAEPAFADTPADAWYTPYVTTLSAMGIVNGYDDGLFHPDEPIPHQQFMTILSRIAVNTNLASAVAMAAGPTEEALAGGDYAAYDPWAVPGAWLLDGRWHADAKDIDPRATTTRAEAAYDLWSMLSSMGLLPG